MKKFIELITAAGYKQSELCQDIYTNDEGMTIEICVCCGNLIKLKDSNGMLLLKFNLKIFEPAVVKQEEFIINPDKTTTKL